MELLESDKRKITILEVLYKSPKGLSFNLLKKKCDALNYRSIRRNCDFLEIVGLIKCEEFKAVEKKKGIQSYKIVKITSNGIKSVENNFKELKR